MTSSPTPSRTWPTPQPGRAAGSCACIGQSRSCCWSGWPRTAAPGAGRSPPVQVGDLDGDVLTIARAASAEVVGPTKTRRIRRLTLGATTAGLWRDSVTTWRERARDAAAFGPWLFSRDADHATRLRASTLGHWFATLAADAGHPDVTLHRLRHTVATTLVGRGDLLQAQQRLGHRDASTTLRIYSHAMPLTDADAAYALDQLYRVSTES